MTKKEALRKLRDENGLIQALALDQREALQQMMAKYGEATAEKLSEFKMLVTQELTPFASAILLDPEYGIKASKRRAQETGLLLAYEKTGYDAKKGGRLPDILAQQSVRRLKEAGADACKFLLYYDVDEPPAINDKKQAFVERIGAECKALGLAFFLELLAYDAQIQDKTTKEFAVLKPHKVLTMMKEFSKSRYEVDVLKVEVPVEMQYVEGFATSQSVYSKDQASHYFKEQSLATELPYIFLSAGVSASQFQSTLRFAKEAGATFNGVLCGRATWADAVKVYMQAGKEKTIEWLRSQGRKNIEELGCTVAECGTAWK